MQNAILEALFEVKLLIHKYSLLWDLTTMADVFYQRHIFFCCNKKKDDTGCGFLGGEEAFIFAKDFLKLNDWWGEGKCRVSKSGCLGRCELGPTCVVYPEGIWYSYVDESDIKEIIEKHVIGGNIVSRLQLQQINS